MLDLANTMLAQAAPANQFGWSSLWPFLLIIVIFYFLMIRPQQKRQKEHKAMVEALTKGDEVITAAGIVGKVTRIHDNGYLLIEVANLADKPVEIMIQRTAINAVLPKGTFKTL